MNRHRQLIELSERQIYMEKSTSDNSIETLRTAEEGHYFDRKSARIKPRELAKTVVAFANAAGGKLVIGIEDDGVITGFSCEGAQSIEEFEQLPLFGCMPAPTVSKTHVPVVTYRDIEDVVLVLDIAPSTDVVIRRRSDDAVFLRQGDKSQRLGDREIRTLEYDKCQRCFEDEVSLRATAEDIDHEVLDWYKHALGTTAADEQVLRSRDFMVGTHLTNAGVLLFAANPTRFLPQARVRVLRYEGTERGYGREFNVVKDVTFEGPIVKTVEGASSLIRSMLRDFQYLGKDGRFQTIPEYPEFAWFEGLVNAVTHRDYAFAGDHIRVSMYDDHLEIRSPGKLPNIVTLENMCKMWYSRNPRIARTLVEFGWVRELNEGVPRIYSEMQALFLHDPVFSEPSDAAVEMVLKNSITSRTLRYSDSISELIGTDILSEMNEYEIRTVQFVYMRGSITSRELAELINRGVAFSSKTLRGLRDKGVLKWNGTSTRDPSQFYSLPSVRSKAK